MREITLGGPRTYRGRRVDGRAVVTVEGAGRVEVLSPVPSQRLRSYSEVLDWSHAAGRSQLALALLLDASGSPRQAESVYQVFRWMFLDDLGDVWVIADRDILDWLAGRSLPVGKGGAT